MKRVNIILSELAAKIFTLGILTSKEALLAHILLRKLNQF